MSESEVPTAERVDEAGPPDEHLAWREGRWQEVAGPTGRLAVVVLGELVGPGTRTVDGAPGKWTVTEDGALTVTATAADGLRVDGEIVDGTVTVASNTPLQFPDGNIGFAGGANGAYGLATTDPGAVARSGLTGIDAYPYDPAWVCVGSYRAAEGRRLTLDRMGTPPSTETYPAPVDLVVTAQGEEYVLPLIEDLPGQYLLIFTDPTNGMETPEIGRWVVLPPLAPGSELTVDFNRATLPYHLLNPAVFTCPAAPGGNHLPVRVEAGERRFVHRNA